MTVGRVGLVLGFLSLAVAGTLAAASFVGQRYGPFSEGQGVTLLMFLFAGMAGMCLLSFAGLCLLRDVFCEFLLCWRLPGRSHVLQRVRQLKTKLHDAPEWEDLRAGRGGLVLAGGGAKGAYEIGALRALRRFGIDRYAAIAGTSVGALNGVLVGLDRLSAAKRVWSNLGVRQVMLADWRLGIAVLTRLLILPLLLPLRRSATFQKQRRTWERMLQSLASEDHPREFIRYFVTVVMKIVVSVATLAGLWLLVVFVMGRDDLAETGLLRGALLAMIEPAAITLAIGILLGWLVHWHNEVSERLPLFSNFPLLQLAKREVLPHVALLRQSQTPVYVTHAAFVGVGYSPIYRDLQDCTHDAQVVDYVLQSAALPEIFSSRVIDGNRIVDGACADNWPLLPVIRQPGIRDIVVIYLDKGKPIEQRISAEPGRLQENSRRLEQAESQQSSGSRAMVAPETRAATAVHERDVDVLAIAPSMHIGGLLTGTLGFSRRKARCLMWLGYCDALDALERGYLPLAWKGPIASSA